MHIDVIAEAPVAPSSHPAAYTNSVKEFASLIDRIRPVLTGLSRKLAGADRDIQADYFQIGMVGAWEAFRSHDANAGQLEHFAVFCAKRQMLKRRRWQKSRDCEIPAGDLGIRDSDTELSAIELEAHEQLSKEAVSYRLCDAVDCSLIWEVAVVVLTSKEFEVMRLIYVRGLLPVEVTSELHISAPRVTQLVKSALAKLRAAITTPFSQN